MSGIIENCYFRFMNSFVSSILSRIRNLLFSALYTFYLFRHLEKSREERNASDAKS